jgi:hypothetical protein
MGSALSAAPVISSFEVIEVGSHYILHTSAVEIPLPHIVVIPPESDIKISAIYL